MRAHTRARTAITHTPQNAHGITTTLSKQAHGHRRPASDHTPHARPARRTGDVTTPQHARQLGDSLAARPAQPPLHPRDIRQAACRQSGQRTHNHARARAGRRRTHASARVCAHLSRWRWTRRAAGRRARGRDRQAPQPTRSREACVMQSVSTRLYSGSWRISRGYGSIVMSGHGRFFGK